jgi:hypothetical protein
MVEFIVFGGPGFVGALTLALTLGRSTKSAIAIAGLGPVLIAALLGLILVRAPDRPYHDEGEYFGFWIHPAVFYVLGFNLAGSFVGTVAGLVLRQVRAARTEPNGVRSS